MTIWWQGIYRRKIILRKESVGSINFKLQASKLSVPVLSVRNTPWSSSVLQRISSRTFQSRGTRARRGHCRWTGLAQVRTWSNGNYVDWKANTSVACVSGKAKTLGFGCSTNTFPIPLLKESETKTHVSKHLRDDISAPCYFTDQKSSSQYSKTRRVYFGRIFWKRWTW